jgi:hypothetical protein
MKDKQLFNTAGQMAVYADAIGLCKPIDMHQARKSKDLVMSSTHLEIKANMGDQSFQTVNFASWLPACAKVYEISPNVEDYIFVPIITMPSDLPNRNGVGFPLDQLTAFSIDEGRLGFETFKGKRVHLEHKNDVPKEALGVIVDVALRKMQGYGEGKVWKLLELLAIDRSKDPTYAKMILDGEMNSYSMGAWVESYICSYCREPMTENSHCQHLHPKKPKDFYELDGQLVYRLIQGMKGFETSIVATPAYLTAISDNLMSMV